MKSAMNPKPRRLGKLGVLLRSLVILPIWLTNIAIVVALVWFFRLNLEIPELPNIYMLEPTFPSRIETLDGDWMAGAMVTQPVPFEELPEHVVAAFIAAEDHEFYQHRALSPRGILRAALENYRQQSISQGASTITQQVARQFLSPERTYERKVREMLLARRIESKYTKEQILDIYLKSVFFGSNAHGITQASWRFFQKDPRELSVLEAATLAGVLPAPSVFNPHASPERALRERNRVLRRLVETGRLEEEEQSQLQAEPIVLGVPEHESPHRELVASARRALVDHFGEDAWGKGGITVVVQEDLEMVKKARAALHQGVMALIERQELKYNPESGEPPPFEGAMVVVDTQTGRLLATVGTAFEGSSEFDRSRQACRQPGSLFKPIVYAEALSRNIGAATMLNDLPLEITAVHGPVWNPRNADYDFRGYMTLADALSSSRNIPVLRLAQHIGAPPIIARARRLGIESPIDPARSMPLGASCVRLMEMARVYAAFQREGKSLPLADIAYFKMPDGSVSHDFLHLHAGSEADDPPELRPQQAVSPEVAFIMMTLLQRVVTRGTASKLPKDWNIAAKTGTTNQYDAWFAALDGRIAVIVWIGAEKNDIPLGRRENAGTVALPVFESFYADMAPGSLDLSEENAPERLEFHAIERQSGLLSRSGERLPFLPRTQPVEWAPSKGTRQSQRADALYQDF